MGKNVLGNNPFVEKKDSIWESRADNSEDGTFCKAATRSGRRCKNRVEKGVAYCRVHRPGLGGSAGKTTSRSVSSLHRSSGKDDSKVEGEKKVSAVSSSNLNSMISQEKNRPSNEKDETKDTGKRVRDLGGDRVKDDIRNIFLGALGEARAKLSSAELPGFSESELLNIFGKSLTELTGKNYSQAGIRSTLEKNLGALLEAMPTALLVERITAMGSSLFEETVKTLRAVLTVAVAVWNPGREEKIDEFGFDEEFTMSIAPLFDFMYSHYWKVQTTGIENVPGEGRALIVANHSGVLPWDATMVSMAVVKEHPQPRHLRCLMLDLFATMPFLSIFFTRTGQLRACPENGIQLLNRNHLVAVFPEGLKGIGKLYAKRYQLQRFGRGGFIRLAIRTDSPIIPVSVVGGEEIYPLIYRADWLANLFNFPYFPITLTFPWLGLLGLIPLPSRWYIDFGKPFDFTGYGEKAIEDDVLVNALSEEVKNGIQESIYDRLKKRTSIFL